MELDLNEPKIKQWKESIDQSGCIFNSVTPLSIQKKRNGELLFAYISADVTSPEGYKLLPILFLRGDAVLVVPEVKNKNTGATYYLGVKQRRIASGMVHLEFPAGMLDRNVNNPGIVAVKELFEETGLALDESHLKPIHDKPLFTSPGASDERIWFFGTTVTLSNDEVNDLQGKICGAADENEHIETVLLEKEEFLRQNVSAQAQLAHFFFENHFK